MGAGRVARGAVAVAALAPGLAWLAPPSTPWLAVAWGAVAVVAALHGLGRGVGAVVGDRDAPWPLAIAWGLAAYLAVAGLGAAVGRFDRVALTAVMMLATAGGAWWCWLRPGPTSWPRPSVAWLAPVLVMALIALHVAGAAATTGVADDGDGFPLGAVARLLATGHLGDAGSLPRTSGLGGHVLMAALVAPFHDVSAAAAIDRGLGLGLAVALTVGWARPGPLRGGLAVVVAILASACPDPVAPLAPLWTVVALVLAIRQSVSRARAVGRPPWAALLVAGALLGIRNATLGIAIAIIAHVIAAAAVGRRRRSAVVALGVVAASVGGLVVAAAAAGGGPVVHVAPMAWAPWLAGAAVVHALLRLASRGPEDPADRLTRGALCLGLAGVGALSPSTPVAVAAATPLVVAMVLALLVTGLGGDGRASSPMVAVMVLAATLALTTLRFPVGASRPPWYGRLADLIDGARALVVERGDRDAATRSAYRQVLAGLPRGARVGLWVDRPELVDYRGRDVVDLRTVEAAACVAGGRPGGPRRACRRLATRLAHVHLDYVVVATAALPPARGWCALWPARACADPITAWLGQRPWPEPVGAPPLRLSPAPR